MMNLPPTRIQPMKKNQLESALDALKGACLLTFMPAVVMLAVLPVLVWQIGLWSIPVVIIWGCALVPSALNLFTVYQLRVALRRGGYEWAGWEHAAALQQSRVEPADILPKDELATLPGYREGDLESLVELLRGIEQRRAL